MCFVTDFFAFLDAHNGAMRTLAAVALLLTVCFPAWPDQALNTVAHSPGVPTNQQTNSPAKSESKVEQQVKAPTYAAPVIPSRPPEAHDKSRNDESEGAAYDKSEYWSILGRNLKITDSLLAIFTLGLVGIGTWQGVHLKRTVDSYVIGERPYIHPTVPNNEGLNPCPTAINPQSIPYCSIGFGNFGKTTGIIREIGGEFSLGDLPAVRKFSYLPPSRGQIICNPGKETDPMPFPYHRPYSAPEFKAVMAGEMKVHVFGYVKYTDIFGQLHEKGFCFRLFSNSKQCETPGGRVYHYSKTTKAPKEYAG